MKIIRWLVKWSIILFVVVLVLTWIGKGPSKSWSDNAGENIKWTITKTTGHEFIEGPPPASIQTQVNVDTGIVSEELIEPNKWTTVLLKDGHGGYNELKVLWKSGPIYRRWLNKDGNVMITLLGIGDTFKASKVKRVDNNTFQPLEKDFHDGFSIQGAAAVQFMAANGDIPVKVILEIR